MTGPDRGGVQFVDRMRITREHMEHLEEVLLAGIEGLRGAMGAGVARGFETKVATPTSVKVSPGLAFDGAGRPLLLAAEQVVNLPFGTATTLYLVARHKLLSDGELDGVPTMLFDEVDIEARASVPPYVDGALPFAGARLTGAGLSVFQKGSWYLVRSNHSHTGTFVSEGGDRRYDGDAVAGAGGLGLPAFDSGFVSVGAGREVVLVHGLQSLDLLVQLQTRSKGVIGTQGHGSAFWYELRDEQHIALRRAQDKAGALEIRATVWPFAAAGAPLRPLANAGDDAIVEAETSFVLDGRRSRALGDRALESYKWTLMG